MSGRRDSAGRGDSTRVVHAGLPEARDGAPFLPGPVFAAPYHLAGPADASPYGYGRDANPTWTLFEQAIGELEGGEVVAFASGMAAVSAVTLPALHTGDVLVAPGDGYPGIRALADQVLRPNGVEVRLVESSDAAFRAALGGATMVWLESPSNPGLSVLDIRGLAAEAHAGGATVVVDNTPASPLRQRPLDLGADLSVTSASKHLSGHSDVLLGVVAVRDAEHAERLRLFRATAGAIPGPFETWLAHRSLATLAVRLERQEANARAVAEALRARPDVSDVRWPEVGSVVCFDVGDAARADALLAACDVIATSTSFGGVHSNAERRARWGTDRISEGYIRLSVGIEDAADLVADLEQALSRF